MKALSFLTSVPDSAEFLHRVLLPPRVRRWFRGELAIQACGTNVASMLDLQVSDCPGGPCETGTFRLVPWTGGGGEHGLEGPSGPACLVSTAEKLPYDTGWLPFVSRKSLKNLPAQIGPVIYGPVLRVLVAEAHVSLNLSRRAFSAFMCSISVRCRTAG